MMPSMMPATGAAEALPMLAEIAAPQLKMIAEDRIAGDGEGFLE